MAKVRVSKAMRVIITELAEARNISLSEVGAYFDIAPNLQVSVIAPSQISVKMDGDEVEFYVHPVHKVWIPIRSASDGILKTHVWFLAGKPIKFAIKSQSEATDLANKMAEHIALLVDS